MDVAAPAGHPALYDTLVALHVACAVVGFGAVALSGFYGATASHTERAGAVEETNRYFRSQGPAEWLVFAVPFLGAGALAVRPGGAHFGDTWVLGAAVIWLAAAVLLLGIVRPAERRIGAAVRSRDRDGAAGPEVVAEQASSTDTARVGSDTAAAGRLLKWGAAGCDVLFVAALVLMIGQPA